MKTQPDPTRPTALHSRPPLERMMRMHERLKAGRYPNCRKLAAELEVSSKTVQRDIDFMRYRLGLPIEYDQLHFGFYYTEPVANFPNIEISEGELVALYVGQKALAQYKGTSFEAPLSTAFRKITDGLRDTISVTWSDLDSAVSFRSTGRSTTDVHQFEQLSHAVFKQLEVRFDYKKPEGSRYESRYVQPYHLGCVENLWYLFAFDVDRQQLRTFALPRIRKIRVSKTKFRRPVDFSIGKFLGESFGVFSKPAKTKYAVRVAFDSFAAPHPGTPMASLTGSPYRKFWLVLPCRLCKDWHMGLRVEKYNLEELHRIAVPGAAPPSLFWVLPVGQWQAWELERLWQQFTTGSGSCSAYGLLLVKDFQAQRGKNVPIDLGSVGATLVDIIPQGADRLVTQSAMRDEPYRLMVLSGAYPQPGWGVLIEWLGDVKGLEALLTNVVRQLQTKVGKSSLDVFEDAAQAYHDLGTISRAKPCDLDLKDLDQQISSNEKARESLASVERGFQNYSGTEITVRLFTAISALKNAKDVGIAPDEIDRLAALHRKRAGAISLLEASEDEIVAVGPIISNLLADPSKKPSIFKQLTSEEAKRVLKASLDAFENGFVTHVKELRSWALATEAEVSNQIRATIPPLRESIDARLKNLLGERSFATEQHDLKYKRWLKKIRHVRESFHSAVANAAEKQWQLGPRFLVALETECRAQQIWVRSIPWDPARMIGWKLIAHDVHLHLMDVETTARKIAPDLPSGPFDDASDQTAIDGSYFTDYVHYLAASQPRLSPRHLAVKFLEDLLRPTELRRLIKEHRTSPPENSGRAFLADSLLNLMGWKKTAEVRETPLAACIQKRVNGDLDTADGLNGNDLRIVLESFCKDLIDVIVTVIGLNEEQVGEVLQERMPEYRRQHTTWKEEVAAIMIGPASMVILALGPLAFANEVDQVGSLVESLKTLSKHLNPLSHHRRPRYKAAAPTGPEIGELINNALSAANTLLGECPWHLEASVVYGDQPKVLTGEAWSHSSPTPRLLRVIVWSGTPVPRNPILWNKTQTNPVITDPVFIERPGAD